MFPSFKGVPSEAVTSDTGCILQRITVALVGFTALACAHAILYHLHYILAPFVLSGFLVFALEPTVERIYTLLAGLAPPYRWCCCGMRRRHRGRDLQTGDSTQSETSEEEHSTMEEYGEAQILLADQASHDWEVYSIRIMDGLCRFAAVVLVLATMILGTLFLLYLLATGALRIKDHWQAYQKGMDGWIMWLDHMRNGIVARLKLSGAADSRVRMVYTSVLGKFQELILALVNSIVGFVTGGVSFALIVLLYMLFWLFQPLPIGGKASALVQNYIWKKALVSFLYGISVAILLYCMGIDLPAFFGLVSCFLNFVPEVGAFISMLAPVPLILLNGNIESPVGWLIVAIIGQVVLKLLIGNVLEMRLVSGDDEMSLHPVWVLLGLNYFGFLWGPVGMLISVPLLATLKSIVIAKEEELKERQPFLADIAGQISACLEGRRRFAERRRSTWLLPFAAVKVPDTSQKEREAMQEPVSDQPQSGSATEDQSETANDAVPKEEALEEAATPPASVPKKSRQ